MNTRMPIVALAGCMVLSMGSIAATPASPRSATDAAAVTRLEQRWIADIAGGNRTDLATILADDYRDIDFRGRIRDKAALLAALGKPRDTSQRISRMDVRVWGDTAVATGVNEVHSPGKGWTVEVPFTDVFARIDGQWRAVSSQETLRKPAAPASGS